MTEQAETVAAAELRAFIERYERLASEKQDIADAQREVMAEAKGRGYSVPILREIIKLRKMNPDDRAEREAVLDLYLSGLGMA
jgi:uncharacterized protein (UPF0335 family)